METIYGIVSDIHASDPLKVKATLKTLQQLGAQKLILNGDLTGERNGILPLQYYLQFLLKAAADTKLETYVQFGSHEEFLPSSEFLNHTSRLYGNIIDVSQQRRIEAANHHLVFLPGSDVNAGGEYTFGSQMASGNYIRGKLGLIPYENKDQVVELAQKQEIRGLVHYENISDLERCVTQPAKTIVICHVPPKFKENGSAVDMACFAESKEGGVMAYVDVKKKFEQRLGKLTSGELERVASLHGYTFKRENRGNEELASLYRQLSITKAISGHFHESVHQAHDHFGRPILENTPVSELFWNASYMDGAKVGLLLVKDALVSYRNIDLSQYQ